MRAMTLYLLRYLTLIVSLSGAIMGCAGEPDSGARSHISED